MSDLPKVISPLASVGKRDGVELILVSVEAWSDEIVVRVRGLPSALTERMESDVDVALDSWHRERRKGPPPDQPAERIFAFDISVSDDVGTAYKMRSASRGGTGTMFRADWTFAPGPPDSAHRLTVGVDEEAATEIDLASQ